MVALFDMAVSNPIFFILYFLVLLSVASAASSCGTPVVELTLQDIQVLPDVRDSFMRGIALKAGTPAQDLVVLPWAELNNLWLYDYLPFCDASIIFDDTICRTRRGNFFYENASSTYHKEDSMATAGGATVETNATGSELGVSTLISSSLIGVDTLGFSGEQTLSKFPIGIPRSNWDHGYTILHAMGMGPNSTILNKFLEAGQITSRVWSIFWGHMWVDNPINGSVILGGYDAEKVIGQNYTQPLDYSDTTGCWTGMKVTITDIELIDRTGNMTSILPSSTAMDVCIVPQRQLLMEAPSAIRDRFENVTGTKNLGTSFGLHWSAALYDAGTAYTGDMKLSFSSGLQVTVPNDQFMVPYVTIDRNGSRIYNESRREFLMGAVSEQSRTLGRYFLTSAYLMVDHDADTFTLWQANPSVATQLVPVLGENADTAACASATVLAQPSATNSSERPSETGLDETGPEETESPTPHSLPIGTTVGIAVGGACVLGLISLGVWYIIRNRRRREQAHSLDRQVAGSSLENLKENNGFRQTSIYEMHSYCRPHEVQGSQNIVYELDGRLAR